MSCEHCTDPDGTPCFPVYGVGPHIHSGPAFGGTLMLAPEHWPNCYRENPDEPGMGVWWCPYCGDGKPDAPSTKEQHDTEQS